MMLIFFSVKADGGCGKETLFLMHKGFFLTVSANELTGLEVEKIVEETACMSLFQRASMPEIYTGGQKSPLTSGC